MRKQTIKKQFILLQGTADTQNYIIQFFYNLFHLTKLVSDQAKKIHKNGKLLFLLSEI